MNKNLICKSAIAALVLAAMASHANAAVNVDGNGVGFAGKGDVQLVFDWNNSALQMCVGTDENSSGCLSFRVVATVITETTWECAKIGNPNTQERARTTTTSTQGLISATARVRKQVTGFNFSGYAGVPAITSTTDGPPLGSCPTNWALINGPTTGDPTDSGQILEVSQDGGANWVILPVTP